MVLHGIGPSQCVAQTRAWSFISFYTLSCSHCFFYISILFYLIPLIFSSVDYVCHPRATNVCICSHLNTRVLRCAALCFSRLTPHSTLSSQPTEGFEHVQSKDARSRGRHGNTKPRVCGVGPRSQGRNSDGQDWIWYVVRLYSFKLALPLRSPATNPTLSSACAQSHASPDHKIASGTVHLLSFKPTPLLDPLPPTSPCPC
jgi:hypothetical protein